MKKTMSKPKVTRTYGPIHFEDLDPHRFEESIYRLFHDVLANLGKHTDDPETVKQLFELVNIIVIVFTLNIGTDDQSPSAMGNNMDLPSR